MSPQRSLRESLNDAEETARAYAAEDAGFDDKVEDVSTLGEQLRTEPSRMVREAIVAALSRMTHDVVGTLALSLLDSEDAFLRSAGVTLLQSRGSSALTAMSKAFSFADADVRKLLLDTATGVPGHEADNVLKLGLADADLNVRVAAVEYLGDRARPELKEYFEALVQCESDAMLLSAALTALEAVGDEATYEAIEARFAREEIPAFLVPLVLKVMARCGPSSCLTRIFKEQPVVGPVNLADWIDAIQSFQMRHSLRIIPAPFFATVCDLAVSDTSPTNLFRLLKWIGCLDQQPGVVDFLATRLRSLIPMVRQGAALGLLRIGTPEARAAVALALAEETDPVVHAAMLEACAQVGPEIGTEVRASRGPEGTGP